MRILVYPHDLAIGGSQINAVDLAAGAAAAGHDVVVYGRPGPLVQYIEKRGLRFIPAHRHRYRPGLPRVLELARLARNERLDLIHAYEWPPCLDAYFGAGLIAGVPLLCTVLSMAVMPNVPASVPLIMGTEALGEAARRVQSADVWVLEPPIDTLQDHPGIDGRAFRRRHIIGQDDRLVVVVSRLAIDLKLDALVRTIDAADLLAARHRIRLLIVGDGEARAALDLRAASINRRHQREIVTLTGAELDPREAYAAADVVIGMGSSALRALAIGRPLVVQGEHGFSEVFEPATLATFLHQGFFGTGRGEANARRLAQQVDRLLSSTALANELGRYGRRIVTERFSLERAVPIQLDIYDKVMRSPAGHRLGDVLRSARRALMLEVRNHDPRRKRRQTARELALMAAASQGCWPPAIAHE
jgi:glycosyltransferase involved in cell wall biosynthesis